MSLKTNNPCLMSRILPLPHLREYSNMVQGTLQSLELVEFRPEYRT
jgi:hypothetical protein